MEEILVSQSGTKQQALNLPASNSFHIASIVPCSIPAKQSKQRHTSIATRPSKPSFLFHVLATFAIAT